jgi:GT2 family glycosyltransferase
MISISIVLYNENFKILDKTISSCLQCNMDIKLFLIDNSPSDILRIYFTDERIEYIHNPSNPGFGASHNIAINYAFNLKSEYHLVLNPDVYFNSGTIETIVDFMDSDHTIGHLMPKVLYPDQSIQFLCKTNPTIFDLFVRGFMPDFLKNIFKNRIEKYEYKSHDFNNVIYDIPYLSGCFMFFRTQTLNKVGYFDDNIFMYLEDADITRRFLQISKTVYYPKSVIFHHYAGLSGLQFKVQ